MVESLIKVGAFDSFGVYRSRLLASYESLIDTEQQKNRNNLSGQLDMFSMASVSQSITPKFKYPELPEKTAKEKLKMEKEVAGMCFSGNLLDSYSKHVESFEVRRISDLLDQESLTDRESARIVGIVTSATVKTTRKNDKMAFFSLEDKYGEIECIAFPNQYEKYSQLIKEDSALCIEGNVSLREDEDPKLTVFKIVELIENGDYTDKKERVTQQPEIKSVARPGSVPKENYRLEHPAGKLYLRVPDLRCAKYKKAANLADIFEGGVRLFFYDNESAKYSEYPHGIDLSDYVYNELIALLGKENVVPK